MSTVEDLHVLVIERCHDDGEHPESEQGQERFCWGPEWQVLHPPTCYSAIELADEDNPHGPTDRCGLDMDLSNIGSDAFDLVQEHAWATLPHDIADLLPAGRYLCRWYFEPGTSFYRDDDRSGIELVLGPVWEGDREGWDRA